MFDILIPISMSNTNLSRRQLFRKYIFGSIKTINTTDPLFEKYSRKSSKGRRYVPAESVTKNDSKLAYRIKPVSSGLNAYTGSWTNIEAMHLLKRTGYGYKKLDVDAIIGTSLSDAVNRILAVDNTVPPPPVVYYNSSDEPDENDLADGADWTNDPFNTYEFGFSSNYKRFYGLQLWLLGKALNQDITIREKMTLFWYHFIPVDFLTVTESSNEYSSNNSARILYQYMSLFRNNSLPNFKTLIRSIATEPSMMFYLNNNANTKTAPDENFAREIMELFTIGKDAEASYTQSDVVEAAKVLTGWRVENLNTATPSTNFKTERHSTEDKKFSAFFDNTVISNQGDKEIDAFIDMIFSKSKFVSEYICRRLYRYFVYYDIDASVETNVIVPLAKVFVDSNWEIKPVLEKLFKSEHFFDMMNRGVYIKSPLDLVVGSFRTFGINTNVADSNNHAAQYNLWEGINYNLYIMDQTIGSIPNVAGWQAFHQKPSYHQYWINSNTTQKRYAYIDYMTWGIVADKDGYKTDMTIDYIAYIKQFSNAVCEDPNLLVAECIKYLLPVNLSIEERNEIKTKTLLSYLPPEDFYWTEIWDNYTNQPNNMEYQQAAYNRIRDMIKTITQFAEYQLM
jgi:uncharacterized protein (DUF1800 family)